MPQIEKALGVKFKTPPKMELRSRDQVREFLLQKLHEPDVQKQLANQEATFKLLGMMPDTLHLADFYVKVLTEQIMGYYDPKTKVLYVVEGRAGGIRRASPSCTSWCTHCRTSTRISIRSSTSQATTIAPRPRRRSSRDRRRTSRSTSWRAARAISRRSFPADGKHALDDSRGADVAAGVPSAPMVIQESLLFPYINGADFIRRFKSQRPGKLPFDSMPVSTEQLMHDSAYFGSPPDMPSLSRSRRFPARSIENNFGEFGTRLFIFQHTKRPGSIDPRLERMGWRPLCTGQDAGGQRVRLGHGVGFAGRRRGVHVGDRRSDAKRY